MKRIVLLTDPHRLDAGLLQRLQWLFPECRVEIVAVAQATPDTAEATSESAARGAPSPSC